VKREKGNVRREGEGVREYEGTKVRTVEGRKSIAIGAEHRVPAAERRDGKSGGTLVLKHFV
jgi:hypothetical protein